MWAKQSTAATLIVGPILDSAGAEYTGAAIGDLSISKNGATLTALAAAATLTHIANGQYTLVMTTGNLDTLGRLQITCNKSTYQMPPVGLVVVPAMVFDSMVLGTDVLQSDVTQFGGTAGTFSSGVPTAAVDSTSIDAIGAAFLAHVLTKGTAGTIERAFWQLSKTQVAVEGVVQADAGNTATVFLTDIAVDDYAGQVVYFVSGNLAGQARPIVSVSSGTLTAERAFTEAPAADDEFLVLPNLTQLVTWIQSGMATATELAKVPKQGETRRYTQVAADSGNKTADVSIGASL